MKNQVTKILIADDHDLIRQGLKTIIGFEKDIKIVGEAENGDKALKLIYLHKPDIVLLDLNMPDLNGIEVLKIIKKQNDYIKVIMLTVENDRKTIHEAIEIGADGYLLKDSAGVEIVSAIRMVSSDEKYIDKSLVSLLFLDVRNRAKKTHSVLDILSKREVEVLMHMAKGMSNKEIGEQLYLSEKTIKNYATNLFRKLNVEDRVQATIFAIENNIEDFYESKYEAQ